VFSIVLGETDAVFTSIQIFSHIACVSFWEGFENCSTIKVKMGLLISDG
jgi:hypothetical protein